MFRQLSIGHVSLWVLNHVDASFGGDIDVGHFVLSGSTATYDFDSRVRIETDINPFSPEAQ